jgi:hypothetical protein
MASASGNGAGEMQVLYGTGSGGEHFADTADGLALGVAEGEEFEAVTEALAVAHDSANFYGIGTERQRDIERNDFAGFELAGESGADAILTEFGGASPAGAELAALEHADLQTDIDGKARIPANVGRRGRGDDAFFARSCHF